MSENRRGDFFRLILYIVFTHVTPKEVREVELRIVIRWTIGRRYIVETL